MEDIRQLEIVEREGQVGMGVLTGIVVTVIGIILLFVSFLVTTKVRGALPLENLTSEETATLAELDSGTQDIFSMMNILLLVGVVTAVIGAVISILFVLRG